jgi:soluble lytic murein transglycosylase
MRTVSRQAALNIIYWNVVLAVLVVCLAAVSYVRRIHRYDTLIVQAAHRHGVDERLIAALIWRESRFNPECIGPKKEVGLMQVTETAGREWARAADNPLFERSDLFRPEVNIEAGTWYLARAISRWSKYSDPLPYALAEYNAGHSNAERWAAGARNARKFWENISYPTTKRYVHDILKRYRGRV